MAKTTRRTFVKGAAAAGSVAAFGGGAPFVKRAFAQGKGSVTYLQTEPMTSSWDPTSHTILGQIYFEHHVFGKLIQTPMRQDNPEEIVYTRDYTSFGYLTGPPLLVLVGLRVES